MRNKRTLLFSAFFVVGATIIIAPTAVVLTQNANARNELNSFTESLNTSLRNNTITGNDKILASSLKLDDVFSNLEGLPKLSSNASYFFSFPSSTTNSNGANDSLGQINLIISIRIDSITSSSTPTIISGFLTSGQNDFNLITAKPSSNDLPVPVPVNTILGLPPSNIFTLSSTQNISSYSIISNNATSVFLVINGTDPNNSNAPLTATILVSGFQENNSPSVVANDNINTIENFPLGQIALKPEFLNKFQPDNITNASIPNILDLSWQNSLIIPNNFKATFDYTIINSNIPPGFIQINITINIFDKTTNTNTTPLASATTTSPVFIRISELSTNTKKLELGVNND